MEEQVNLPEEIQLPACEKCGHVGKVPLTFNYQSWCLGPKGSPHKRLRMVPYRFKLVGPVEVPA